MIFTTIVLSTLKLSYVKVCVCYLSIKLNDICFNILQYLLNGLQKCLSVTSQQFPNSLWGHCTHTSTGLFFFFFLSAWRSPQQPSPAVASSLKPLAFFSFLPTHSVHGDPNLMSAPACMKEASDLSYHKGSAENPWKLLMFCC